MDMLGTWDGRCGHSKLWPGRSGSSFLGATWPMLYSGIWWCMLLGAQQSRAFGTTRDTFRTAHVCIGICWTSTSWNTRIQAAILSNIYIVTYIYIYIHMYLGLSQSIMENPVNQPVERDDISVLKTAHMSLTVVRYRISYSANPCSAV